MTIAQQVNYAMTRASVCMSTLPAAQQLEIAQAMQRVADALEDDGPILGPSLWSDQSQWCEDLAASTTSLDAGRYWAFCRAWEDAVVYQLSNLASVLRGVGCADAAEVADSAAGSVAAESEQADVVLPSASNLTIPSPLKTAAVIGGLALLILLARS